MRSVASPVEQAAKKRRLPRLVSIVACGYCQGSGADFKYGMASRCPVCAATGRIKVNPPVVTCLRCGGFGRENGDLTCLACRGTGVGQIRNEALPCVKCERTGSEGVFYCIPCKGQGLV
jgi:DnaJ-class molecular chaperone